MIPKRLFLVLSVAVGVLRIQRGRRWCLHKPLIVSGVSEWGALAYQLVGADAKVVSLLTDPNADPHEHEATISDAAKRGPGVGRPGERRRLRHVARNSW